jgi:FdhD protein
LLTEEAADLEGTKKNIMLEAVDVPEMRGVAEEVTCDRFADGGWAKTSVGVPFEKEITIYVNLQELVTIQCTPTKLDCLVVGFLYAEGVISGLGDIAGMNICETESMADVRLVNPDYQVPTSRTITSGCGGGAVFKIETRKVDSAFTVKPEEILLLMRQLQEHIETQRVTGGIHTSALADRKELLLVTEDIGRHNTLDKIQGECLMRGIPTRDRLVLTTGRVSSEMLLKAARMETPVVVSRHSPTGAAVSIARDLGVALVGYVRGNRFSVYSHPERLGGPA